MLGFLLDETLAPRFQQYVRPAKAIFPLSKAAGPLNALGEDEESSGTEINMAYDPLWVPTGLTGSPMFSSRVRSHMVLDMSTIFPENIPITQISILMWVKPRVKNHIPIIVS